MHTATIRTRTVLYFKFKALRFYFVEYLPNNLFHIDKMSSFPVNFIAELALNIFIA
jgi:hypothetical protein